MALAEYPSAAFFAVPIAVSVVLFWNHGRLGFLRTLLASVAASTAITVVMASLIVQRLELPIITAAYVIGVYLPLCALVGLTTLASSRRN